MADDPKEGGASHKLGIGAALLAAIGGFARYADDCGRATLHSGVADDVVRGGKGLGDDVARGAKPRDDLFRPGAAMADDMARGRPGLAAAAQPGETSLLHVVDDAAPGSGSSLEEALAEIGVDVAFEVITLDLPSDDRPDDPTGSLREDELAPSASAAPPRVLAAATWPGAKADFAVSTPGDVLAIVVAEDAAGAFAFGDERIDEPTLHARCHAKRVRCVIAACVDGGVGGCTSLAAGMGRKAASSVPASGSAKERSLVLAGSMIQQRASLRAGEITISRLDAAGERVVRSRLANEEREPGRRAPR